MPELIIYCDNEDLYCDSVAYYCDGTPRIDNEEYETTTHNTVEYS